MKRNYKFTDRVIWKELLIVSLLLSVFFVSVYLGPNITGNVINTGVWIPIEDSNYINNTALFSNSINSSLVYNLSGEVILTYQTRDDFGMLDVYIDGALADTIDLYSSITKYNVQRTYNVGSEFRLVINGNKNNLSSGYYVLIDEVTNKSVEMSSQVIINNQTITETVFGDKTETVTQGFAVIGKPVKWNKNVKLKDPTSSIIIELPLNITNVSVYSITNNAKVEVNINKIKVKEQGQEKPIAVTNLITGNVIGTQQENVDNSTEIIVEEEVEEVEIEYYTEAPVAHETNISSNKKEIVISSETHYENILAYTTITESPLLAIKLYRTTGGIRELTELYQANDNNNNGLIDEIYWVVPSLSNQTYEVEITVLDVFSYPHSGDNWTVRFETSGTADLRISPTNAEYGNELDFLELNCGSAKLAPIQNGTHIIYNDYNCDNETGNIIHYMNISGYAILKFEFGEEVAYAYDPSLPTVTSVNITPSTITNATLEVGGVWSDGRPGARRCSLAASQTGRPGDPGQSGSNE